MRIGLIGGGNMGYAFARALILKGISSSSELTIIEQNSARRSYLSKKLGCTVLPTPSPDLRRCAVIFLCIKPQDCVVACEEVRKFISSKQIVLSVMAGITTTTLKKLLPGGISIIRTMPNLPAEIDRGMTVYFVPPSTKAKAIRTAHRICAATGAALRVKDESLMNQATAVSASGPAYVFYLIENMQQAAESLGFTPHDAALLTYHTLLGATELWKHSRISAGELRARVTSKKGTTHAAFSEFEKGKLGAVLQRGIRKASQRAQELGE